MIFVYQRIERYNSHIATKPAPKVANIIETRIYFAGGEAIRVTEGKKQVAASDREFTAAVGAIKDLSEKLKQALEQ